MVKLDKDEVIGSVVKVPQQIVERATRRTVPAIGDRIAKVIISFRDMLKRR